MSNRAPRIKWRKAIKAAESLGWTCVRTKGSHAIYTHPDCEQPITLVINKPSQEVSAMVHRGLKQQMGPTRYAEFLKKAS